MTGHLQAEEDRLFDTLRRRLRTPLYRDGLPQPEIYGRQPVKVVLVFREPNLKHVQQESDMRAEVRDAEFRRHRNGQFGSPGSIRGWWNNKVGLFAHAVDAAMRDVQNPKASFESFNHLIADGTRLHDYLFRLGFMQIKKTGGGGTAVSKEIEAHAREHHDILRAQIDLYGPNLLIGCGMPPASPARLLNEYVLSNDDNRQTTSEGFAWWKPTRRSHCKALLEFRHPSYRGSKEDTYCKLLTAVRDVLRGAGLAEGR